jgi:hypothetical protein
VGTSHEWGLERQTLGRYADELTQHCQSSLLIARRYTRTIAHLQPIADAAVAPSVAEPAHTESP